MITSNEIAPVGKVIKSHGFNGELAIACNADFNMEACDYFVFDIESIFVPFFIAEYRFKDSTTAIVRFDGIIDETAAREFFGKTVYIKKELLNEIVKTEVSLEYFIGFSVKTQQGNLGTVDNVDDSTANTLLIVGDKLIPINESLIDDIDHDKRILYMNLPEGLLDL